MWLLNSDSFIFSSFTAKVSRNFCSFVLMSFLTAKTANFFVLMFLCLFLQSPGSLLGGSTGTVGLAFGFEQLRLGLLGADILLGI